MRKSVLHTVLVCLVALTVVSCSGYNKIAKASDYNTKFSLAKDLFAQGRFTTAGTLLEECVAYQLGTDQAEESMFLLATCYFNLKDYVSASQYYMTCYRSYPGSAYSDESLFRSGYSLFLDMPDPRLDPTSTQNAIVQLQNFVETCPYSRFRPRAEELIAIMYDRLVEKELKSADLYYNMGNYLGNNFRSAIIVAENALRDYPFTKYREDLSLIILKAKFEMAQESVLEKRDDRYRDAIDEYYAFKNEYPESGHMKEADRIFRLASRNLNQKEIITEED